MFGKESGALRFVIISLGPELPPFKPPTPQTPQTQATPGFAAGPRGFEQLIGLLDRQGSFACSKIVKGLPITHTTKQPQ